MKKILIIMVMAAVTLLAQAQTQAPAFPGAEGHGRYVTGGRGGEVRHVTTLTDDGETSTKGTLRWAVNGSNKKIVVFDVAGVIKLTKELIIGANTTILGQTAPSPGITIRYYTVRPNGNNIIMRYIRVRRGQEKDINDGADACWTRHFTNIILDHCSFSWSIDEVASFYDNNNFTMQWCTIGESLVNAGHDKGAHGYGGIWGGKMASFHHNMILHVANRSPRFCGARYDWTGFTSNQRYSEYQWQNAVQAENVDFRNCVIYNANGCYGGPGGGQINMVGNYYKSGPAATVSRLTTVSYADEGNSKDNPKYWGMTSRYYLDGNRIDDKEAGWEKMSYDASVPQKNNVHYTYDEKHYYGADSYTQVNGKDALPIQLDTPAPAGEVTTHSAATAFEKVLGYGGASLYRDDVDARYMTEARSGTATYTGSVTKKKGLIDVVSDCNGYTEANFPTATRNASEYTVKDGIPDAWAKANGLDPTKNNANGYDLDPKGLYTNLEVYANSLVQDIMLAGNSDAESAVKEYYPGYVKEDGTVVYAINDGSALHGSVSWAYGEGKIEQASQISSEFAGMTTGIAAGENLTTSNIPTYKPSGTDVTLTLLKSVAQQTEANNDNALTFKVNVPEGYAFTPTSIAFKVANYNDKSTGMVAAHWVSNDGTKTTVCEALKPAPISKSPYFTQVEKELTGAPASTGTCSLVINLYNFGGNSVMGLADIVVNGALAEKKDVAGDLNGDGKVNATDLVMLNSIIIGKTTTTANTDLNGDGQTDVSDVVKMVSLIFGSK